MAKRKTLLKTDIITAYMDYVLEHGQQPTSVYAFSKANKLQEEEFYKHFGSFKALEKYIFRAFLDNTLEVLHKSEDYKDFDARNKLLSFYYTLFENLTANRSYIVFALQSNKNHLKSLSLLSEFREGFLKYIENLEIKTLDLKQETLLNIQDRSLKESAWFQLMVTLRFWLDDTSASFEKTDIFIEKSVKASFDLIDTTPLQSIIDLGKFLFKEKLQVR